MTRFSGTFGTLRFDKNSFFITLFGVTPYWDYKPSEAFHADSPGVCTGDKILYLYIINEINLKCNVIDGSIVGGLKQPILFNFVLDKLSGHKVFCEPETIHYKKIKKSVSNTETFHLEDDNHKEVCFENETLTFTIQMNKV